MALGALHGLGAPQATRRILRLLFRDLVPARAEVVAARAQYEREFARKGVGATLRTHVPRLLPGIGSAAFHGVIRLAYAIDARHEGQVAAALAYWDQVLVPLSDEVPYEGSADPLFLLRNLRASPSLSERSFDGADISSKMAAVASIPAFADAGGIAAVPDTLRHLADATRALYAATNDFVALHTMTGTHATRVVSAFLDKEHRSLAVRFLYQAIAAAYITIGTPSIVPTNRNDTRAGSPLL